MITVCIMINGSPIITRSAVNKIHEDEQGRTMYKCDDGTILRHKREDGAVALAKQMLDTVVESGAMSSDRLHALDDLAELLDREKRQRK